MLVFNVAMNFLRVKMLRVFLLCSLNVWLVLSKEHLTNIDYIGLGYDAVLGNPHSDLYDPGFKHAVLELTYNKVELMTLLIVSLKDSINTGRHDFKLNDT
jgi:hypothetical protein